MVRGPYAPRLPRFDAPTPSLHTQKHPRQLAGGDRFAEAGGKRVRHGCRVHEGAEHAVPQAESSAEVLAAVDGRRVMDSMVGGRNDQPGQRSDIHIKVGMFPKLDQQPDRITDASLGWAEMEESDWDHHLWNGVEERVKEAGAQS